MFPYDKDVNKRAGSCRTLFQHKELESYRLVSVNEEGCCMSQVEVQVSWKDDNNQHSGILCFASYYNNCDGNALPWKNNGAWTLIPRDVRKLHYSTPVAE